MTRLTDDVGNLSRSSKEYLDLRIEDFKLRTVKGLSITLNHLLSLILVLFAVSVVMLALAIGLIALIGEAIGSMAVGAFIVAAVFAAMAVVIFLLRGKLFVNNMVKMFMGIFFEDGENDTDNGEEDVQ